MSAAATDARTAHDAGVERLLASYRAVPAGSTVRLAKRTSNLFRTRAKADAARLDTSGLTHVISVDRDARTADVAGMCTYEDLVAATLPFGLVPLVVPQLKTITLGGAVTGLGIESTSFRNGLPHESVLEMDILTGAGEVVTATRSEHADLFRAFPNSYGTLGYAVRLRIELEPVLPFVALTHVRFHDLADLVATMDRIVETGRFDTGTFETGTSETGASEGLRVDFLDGVVFGADEGYLCLGTQTAEAGPVADYTGRRIYYRSIQHADGVAHDRLTTHDYLWRWDADWFWCSQAFGAQHPLARRLWPRRLLRSSFYGRLMRLERRFDLGDRLERLHGRPARERVIQDVEVPIDRCVEFLDWFLERVPIEPIWLCPLRLRDEAGWPLYPLGKGRTYVNVGFWSTVPVGATEGETNRLIEREVGALDGHKSLYSDSFYAREEFDALYGGEPYLAAKRRYDPDSRLLDLYAKAVRRR
ncbi:FAD/FMN-containing dehydrogenase [Agromyces sp. CF514]|uniref:FAD-binding oxidoreductase n=1 Tax=Agromyces sp. CF514 TaxID=1881031 RepID=UPI0008E1B669|nr:FAD-binding oxidoreductase [Agromyces sp. CF514]SFR70348.1 FAD/FMN-containing dehydrogenase [Agromyces sp. CF514]